MNDTVRTIRSLQIPDVKVYEAVGNQVTVLTKGTLELLYSAEFDRFILRVNSFYYVLSVYLPVMACLFEARAYRAYTLPSLNGYFILKLKTEPGPFVVQNFETVLSNYSRFSFKCKDGVLLKEQARYEDSYMRHVGYQDKENVVVNEAKYQYNDNLGKAGDYLIKGANFLKNNLLKGANYLGKNIDKQQGRYQVNVRPKTIDELKGLYANAEFVDFPGSGMAKLIEISNQIQQKQSVPSVYPSQVTTVNPGQTTTWASFKDTTAGSAKSLWGGMGEAVGIVSNAITNRRNANRKVEMPKNDNRPVIVDQKVQPVNTANVMPAMKVTESVRIHKEVDPVTNLPVKEHIVQETVKENVSVGQGYQAGGLYPYIEPAPGYYAPKYPTSENWTQ